MGVDRLIPKKPVQKVPPYRGGGHFGLGPLAEISKNSGFGLFGLPPGVACKRYARKITRRVPVAGRVPVFPLTGLKKVRAQFRALGSRE